jgi:hypothetical protein
MGYKILLALFLVGCSGLPRPDVDKVRIPDMTNKVCTVYQFDQVKQVYKKIQSLPLIECDGIVGLTPRDFKNAQNWYKRVNQEYTCKKR